MAAASASAARGWRKRNKNDPFDLRFMASHRSHFRADGDGRGRLRERLREAFSDRQRRTSRSLPSSPSSLVLLAIYTDGTNVP